MIEDLFGDRPPLRNLAQKHKARNTVRRRAGSAKDRYTSEELQQYLEEFAIEMKSVAEGLELSDKIDVSELAREKILLSHRPLPAVAYTAAFLFYAPDNLRQRALSYIGAGGGQQLKGIILYDLSEGFREFSEVMDVNRDALEKPKNEFLQSQYPFCDALAADPTGMMAADRIAEVLNPSGIRNYTDPEVFKLGVSCARDEYKNLYRRVAKAIEGAQI